MNKIIGSIQINAIASKVWDTLTNPEKIILYTGSLTNTDWSVGSTITWSGEMHGTRFENKGKVIEIQPNNILKYTYWSGMGGDIDLPENYSEITFTLSSPNNEKTELTYSRINIATEIEKQIFEQFLPSMLSEIKKISEQ